MAARWKGAGRVKPRGRRLLGLGSSGVGFGWGRDGLAAWAALEGRRERTAGSRRRLAPVPDTIRDRLLDPRPLSVGEGDGVIGAVKRLELTLRGGVGHGLAGTESGVAVVREGGGKTAGPLVSVVKKDLSAIDFGGAIPAAGGLVAEFSFGSKIGLRRMLPRTLTVLLTVLGVGPRARRPRGRVAGCASTVLCVPAASTRGAQQPPITGCPRRLNALLWEDGRCARASRAGMSPSCSLRLPGRGSRPARSMGLSGLGSRVP